MYFMLLWVRVWALNARLSFSEDSNFIICCLAACCAFKWSAMSLLPEIPSKAGNLLLNKVGKFGFFPNTNWWGLKPKTFCKEFFAFSTQHNATSTEQWISSWTFETPSPIIQLCLSTNPLLHGASAAVVTKLIFKFWHISIKSALANSPPLSDSIFCGVPNIAIHDLNNALIITSLFLDLITVPAENLVAVKNNVFYIIFTFYNIF